MHDEEEVLVKRAGNGFNTFITIISIILCIISLIVSFTALSAVRSLIPNESAPETEGTEVTDSTSAPDTTGSSLTDIEDIIPTDPTEVETTEPKPSDPPSEPTSAPVIEETTPIINQDELEMLACVIFQEAGGDHQCDDCRRRVADIVLNRVADSRFPNTMYKVLTAKSQYGRYYWTGIVWPDRATNPGEKHAVERAYRIAREVLSGQHSEVYGKGYVWQARFVQGTEGFWCCGTYFGKS